MPVLLDKIGEPAVASVAVAGREPSFRFQLKLSDGFKLHGRTWSDETYALGFTFDTDLITVHGEPVQGEAFSVLHYHWRDRIEADLAPFWEGRKKPKSRLTKPEALLAIARFLWAEGLAGPGCMDGISIAEYADNMWAFTLTEEDKVSWVDADGKVEWRGTVLDGAV